MDRKDLLTRRLGDEDVATGQPRISHEPIQPVGHPEGDIKIGKSLRVPMDMFARINDVAARRRMSWSALVRAWIEEGLERDATGEVDPVLELHHHLDAAGRALRQIENRPAA